MNLYIENLPRNVSEDDVRKLFDVFGKVESVYIVPARFSDTSGGSAYVLMPSDSDAQKAQEQLHGKEYKGERLRVVEADAADFPTGDFW